MTEEAAKILGEGTITAAVMVLYICPARTTAIIQAINVSNNGVSISETVKTYFRRSSDTAARRRYRQVIITTDESATVLGGEHPIMLEAGDVIEASTTTDNATDYVVMGRELHG